ncbi:MAG: LysM peptidoglycan-binding domain-containing protein, partial [Desulfovibrionales bacterium]|nr:LysM peptidoglycan-binding domain-containing protein [Desulfovibrionales bacterium]
LAITAYNHGLNGMLRAKKQKGSYEEIFASYKSRYFGFASRNFYAEFLAARRVAKGAQAYFGKLSPLSPSPPNGVILSSYLPVKALEKALKLNHGEIKDLNPALDTCIFTGEKYIPRGYTLNLPPRIPRDGIHEKLTPHYKSRQRPSKFHRVKKGDTAMGIARANGISLSRLKQANNLNRRGFIRVGQTLRIPRLPNQTTPKIRPKTRSKDRSKLELSGDQLSDASPAPTDTDS